MNQWFMLTVVGRDRPGIVARVTSLLYEGGCNLGEASMVRLGGNFTIMLMVQYGGELAALRNMLKPDMDRLELHIHIDEIDGRLHQHLVPDVRISVFGADRAGIVAQVTQVLGDAGLNVLDLESDVAGTKDQTIYIMHIEGCATQGIDALRHALDDAISEDIDVSLAPIDTLIG